jgi:hypothetical protein
VVKTTNQLREDSKLVTIVKSAVEDCSDDDGWANLSDIGNIINNKSPAFDSRNYGYKKLKDLVKDSELFDIEERQIGSSPGNVIFLKIKKAEKKNRKSVVSIIPNLCALSSLSHIPVHDGSLI